jgi:hypothetical protein
MAGGCRLLLDLGHLTDKNDDAHRPAGGDQVEKLGRKLKLAVGGNPARELVCTHRQILSAEHGETIEVASWTVKWAYE